MRLAIQWINVSDLLWKAIPTSNLFFKPSKHYLTELRWLAYYEACIIAEIQKQSRCQ